MKLPIGSVAVGVICTFECWCVGKKIRISPGSVPRSFYTYPTNVVMMFTPCDDHDPEWTTDYYARESGTEQAFFNNEPVTVELIESIGDLW